MLNNKLSLQQLPVTGNRVLLTFRTLIANPLVQVGFTLVYQLYLLYCLALRFNIRADIASIALLFGVADILFLGVSRLIKLNAPLLFAADLLLTTGFSAQCVFVDTFPETTGTDVREIVTDSLLFIGVGIVAGAVCMAVCYWVMHAGRQQLQAKAVPFFCILLCLAAIATAGYSLATGSQWLFNGRLQPGEFIKFGFLFFTALVAGVAEEYMSYRKKLFYLVSVYLLLALTYVAQSELGSLLVVTAVFALFLIIYSKSWLLTGGLLGFIAVFVCVVMAVVISFGNSYIEEVYADPPAEGEEITQEEPSFFEQDHGKLINTVLDKFTSNYEKVYMRFMVCVDIDGTDPNLSQTLRDVIQEYYVYQARCALNAIGISGLFSTGPVFTYVPVGESDYIYTSILQTGGYLSILVMLAAFLILADTTLDIVCRNCPLFGRYGAFLMAATLVVQMCINVLGVNNLLPLTGITIPLVSKGGSSLAVSFMMLAVILVTDLHYHRTNKKYTDNFAEAAETKGGCFLVNDEPFAKG